jgi:hypothetical protein
MHVVKESASGDIWRLDTGHRKYCRRFCCAGGQCERDLYASREGNATEEFLLLDRELEVEIEHLGWRYCYDNRLDIGDVFVLV